MTKQSGSSSHEQAPLDAKSLDARIKAAQTRHTPPPRDKSDGTLLGMAWRLSTELLVAVLVGYGLGYGLDKLFGTEPWIMVLGLGFGFAAGIRNVLRVADKMDTLSQTETEPGSNGDKPEQDATSSGPKD